MVHQSVSPAVVPEGSAVKLLLVEDNPGDARLVQTAFDDLAREDSADLLYELTVVDRLSNAIEALSEGEFHLVLLDMGLPDSMGLDTIGDLRSVNDQVPVVVLTGNQDEETAIRALRAGAQDYLVKGQIDTRSLTRSVRHALERGNLGRRLLQQEATNRRILASLSAHIAVLDEEGRITHTNLAWDRFADRNGGRPARTGVGVDYIEICHQAADGGDQTAAVAEEAIQKVMAGQVQLASLEYPCHSPNEERWFAMRVTPLGSEEGSGVVVAHEDVTERHRAELQLERSEKHFRSVIENASDLIAILRPDGRSTYLSPSTERMLGMSIESLLGECVFDFIHPDDLSRARAALRMAFDHPGIPHNLACRLLHPEKGWIDIDAVGKAERYDGRLQVVLTARDISQRREVERQLRRERDRFQLLAEHGPVGITLVNAEGEITFANPEAERVLGLQPSEIVGMSYQDPQWAITDFDGAPYPEDRLPFAQVKETLKPIHDVRHAITWPDGERKLLSISGAPILDADGVLDSVVFSLQDVTESVRSEQALASNERRFRSMVQNASDVITIVDRDRHVTYESPSLERVMGYAPEDVIGLDVIEPVHPADQGRVVKAFDALISGSSAVLHQEMRVLGADGAFRDLEVIGTNLLDDPAVAGIVLNSRDITTRRRQDREQEAILQMASALREAGNRSEMIPIILNQIRELFGAGGAAIVTLNPKVDQLQVELAVGSWAGTTGLDLSAESAIDWEIYRTGQPYVEPDVRTDAKFQGADRLGGDTAAVGAPLLAHGRPLGSLWAGRDRPFEPEEVRVLTALADMAANALRRVALHEETRRRADQLATVTKLGMSLGETLELQVIFERLADSTLHLLPDIRTVLISRFEAKRSLITCAFGLHDGEPINVSELAAVQLEPKGQGMLGEVIHSREPLVLNDVRGRTAQEWSNTPFGLEGSQVHSAVLVPMLARGEVIGVVQGQSDRPDQFDETDAELLSIVANTAAVAIANADLFTKLQGTNVELALAYDTTLEGWARALELRDKETEGHTRRVTDLTVRLAAWLGLPEDQLVNIRRGALLHDIGKMGIPDSILLKPGTLDDDEWEVMRTHPLLARQMLEDVDFLRPGLTIPYYHHERWDGSGYPEGLIGEQIPIEGRVFAVVDVYDALRSDRPYRDAWSDDRVRTYLTENAGVLFDPEVVAAFFEMIG